MRRAALAVAAAAALFGCGGEDNGVRSAPPSARASDASVIRGWIAALNRSDYERAASYFARGAIVEQVVTFRLRDRASAIAFNRSLPCRADVTDIDDEGRTTLAAFRLRQGPGGPGARCDGSARVRFTIRSGKFTEWRQLPEPPPPAGRPV
jgi:hypothetical protein